MNFSGRKVSTAAHDPVLINFQFIWGTEGDNFISNPHRQLWKVITGSIGPLEINLVKSRIRLGLSYIPLQRIDVAA